MKKNQNQKRPNNWNQKQKKIKRPVQRKMSKKECYAKYNVEFDGKYIVSPIGKIPEFLKKGNSKTGEKVFTFSILPGTTVIEIEFNGMKFETKGTCICNCIGCYAQTGFYRMDNVILSMAVNTYLVNHYPDFVKRCIMAQLEYIGRGEIRIHAAGDFNTADPETYAAMWHEIAEKFNTFRFWTYTKVKKFESLFDDLKNANIVKSVIPGIGVNFGHCDYIINAYYTLREMGKKVYICKCGIDKNQHCENCGICATYDYVLFLEHSTSYKAEQDPLYEKLCEIVNNQ